MSNDTEWFEGQEADEAAMVRCYWRRLALVTFCAAVAVYGLFGVVSSAHAVPPAQSAQECVLVGDMVLVAAALEKNTIDADKRVPIMADTYAQALGSDTERWGAILGAVMRFVKRDASKQQEPMALSELVNMACQMNRGNLDAVFGVDA